METTETRFAVLNDIGVEVNRYGSRAFAENVARSVPGGRVVDLEPAGEPEPGCYRLPSYGAEGMSTTLVVVLGLVTGRDGVTRFVDYMHADCCRAELVLEAWPRRAQRLTGDRADDVLWLAQQFAAAGHRAAVRDGEREYGEAAALRHAFARLAGRLYEASRG